MSWADDELEAAQEALAERRAEVRLDEIEQPDQWGRDADWNWPRGFGGDPAVPW